MARDHYLASQVKTATPQKLQLLLIDSALRSANRARQYWQQGRDDLAVQSLLNAQDVVAQMLAAIDREAGGDLAQRVAAVYAFIYRCLVRAGHRHDEKGLADAVRILGIERETWRQLCDKLAAEAPHASFHNAERGVPAPRSGDSNLLSPTGGFSIEV
jgi:flagellar protein FliS